MCFLLVENATFSANAASFYCVDGCRLSCDQNSALRGNIKPYAHVQ